MNLVAILEQVLDPYEPTLSVDSLFQDGKRIVSGWKYGPDGRPWQLSRFSAREAGAEGIGGIGLIGFGSERMLAISVGADHDIGSAFERLKNNRLLQRFERRGSVRVSWMAAPESQWDGIKRYLIERLSPLMRQTRPEAPLIPVEIPREYRTGLRTQR